MKIKPKYVTFEQANLLKEKGFDAKTYYNYDLTGEIHHVGLLNHNETEKKLSRPEHWQVVEWLILKYNIHIIPYPILMVKNGCEITQEEFDYSFQIINKGINEWIPKEHFEYKSQQEAYDAAFLYVLKNLI